MALTYSLITGITVGSTGSANIEFTNIPSSFTDLVILCSIRSSYGTGNDAVFLRFNNDTGNNYNYRFLRNGGGSTPDTGNNLSTTFTYVGQIPTGAATASTFANGSIYIPNYSSSNYKSLSANVFGENYASSAFNVISAGSWISTSAITSIKLYLENGPNFAQYSSAYLYGIKNS